MMLRFKGKIAVLAAMAMAALPLTACGGAAEPTPQPTPTTTAAVVAATPTPAPAGAAATPAATPTPAREKPQYGGTFRFQTTNPRVGQDPVYTTGTGYFNNYGLALSTLLRYKIDPSVGSEEYIVVPDLVERWETPEPTVYVMHLRRGVKYQNLPPLDGREFVADDAVFGVKRLAAEGSAARSYWAAVETVEALDRYTIRFTLKEPLAEFLNNVAYGLNKMTAPEAVEAGGGNLRNGPTVGTGPWYITCEVDIQCVSRKNPEYYMKDADGNPLPYMDGMRNIVIEDVQARFAAFRSKQLDVHGLTPEQREIVESRYPQVKIDQYNRCGCDFIHFRGDQAPWSDVRVRQAVSKALDRQEIIDTIYGGFGTLMAVAVNGVPSRDALLPQEEVRAAYKRDVAGARQLLADAGYPNGIDAKLWVANYGEADVTRAELVQHQLAEVGIRVTLFIHDRATYLSRVYIRHGEFEDLATGPQGAFTTDQWLKAYFHSEGGRNTSYVNDPVLDKMIEDQGRELDVARRSQIIIDIQRYLLEKSYQIILRGSQPQSAVWPWVKNRAFSAGLDYGNYRHYDIQWIDQPLYNSMK